MTIEITKKLDGIATNIDDLRKSTSKQVEDIMKAAQEATQKALDAEKEAKSYGASFADTKAKLDEITGAMAGFAKTAQDNHGKVTKLSEALEKLNRDLIDLQQRGGNPSDLEELTKEARDFYSVKHYGEMIEDIGGDRFDEAKVDTAAVEKYKAARNLFWNKIARLPAGIANLHMGLTQEEMKAVDPLIMKKSISTITHGNRFWLTYDTGYEIQCWDYVTDLGGLFASMWISRGGVEMIKTNDVQKRALFRCEMDCNPGRNPAPAAPGTVVIPANEMTDHECITHTMLEDSEIDLEGWLIPRVAEGFTRGRNEKFLWGDGNGMPTGLLRPGNHVAMAINPIGGSPAGEITWQHLRIMPFQVAKRFQARGSYMISRDALMSIFTMADGMGRPLIDNHLAVGADGIMRLWGYPIYQIDQLQNYLDTAGAPQLGAKPVGFGSWQDAYLVVNRRGFFVVRDPAYNPCGVTWWFGQRVGGGVLCENASVFLEVV